MSNSDSKSDQPRIILLDRDMSRRGFLKGAAALALGVGSAGSILEACSTGGTNNAASTGKGGTLVYGMELEVTPPLDAHVAQDGTGLCLDGLARSEGREEPLIASEQEFYAGEAAQSDVDGQQESGDGEEPEGDRERGIDRRQVESEGGSVVAAIEDAATARLPQTNSTRQPCFTFSVFRSRIGPICPVERT